MVLFGVLFGDFLLIMMKKTLSTTIKPKAAMRKKSVFEMIRSFMGSYSTTYRPYWIIATLFFLLGLLVNGKIVTLASTSQSEEVYGTHTKYWFLLQRTSNIEYLYVGIPNDRLNSKLMRTFVVKTGIPHERPTPLPQLVGRDYWLITKKYPTDNPETAPYFLELDVPGIDKEPYGPSPYTECHGQCNWILPGSFGLHGVNDDNTRLSKENAGSSGCIRHSDTDITFLYQLLEPQKEEIRYYIHDL